MRDIFLPNLKSIEILDYSLYFKKPSFKYEFINGINLIIGGNGVGKTTLINLIKYGLIGLYKKDLDVRVYKYNKIENRVQFSNDYFRNRMSPLYTKNKDAKVILSFIINDMTFEVTRKLYDLVLETVKVERNGETYMLTGKVAQQSDYQKIRVEEDKKIYLQYNYEQTVKNATNLSSFDDFIFFVNEVLVFGENRKTILWDVAVQEKLSSKYFNSLELDEEYEKSKRDAKYNDSLSRHKSEEIKAIKKVLKTVEEKNNSIQDIVKVNNQIGVIKTELEKKEKTLSNIQKERKEIENKRKIKLTGRANLDKEINELESKINKIHKVIYEELWQTLNPQYHLLLRNLKQNHVCPLCNKELTNQLFKRIISAENKCMLCESDIHNDIADKNEVTLYKAQVEEKLLVKQNIETEIYNFECELQKLDVVYRKQSVEFIDLQSKLRDLEHVMQSYKPDNNNETLTYNIMLGEIKKLEIEKDEFQNISKEHEDKCREIAKKMDDYRVGINKELSNMFSSFAESFLKVPSFLTYDNLDGDGNRYVPVINNQPRIFQEELSESQCFFVDHSFRMSLLNYFYNQPSFFICETPEGSLDISYEMNAAQIFLKYLDKPNSLIITSNLNNSEFIEYIIDNSNNISYINLLEIGNPSAIQESSLKLQEISKRIEEKIYAKSKIVQA